jgi:hypothetical protein
MKKGVLHFRQRGAALIELMVSSMVVLITGSIVFYMLNTGMVLFAKNTAINMAHQQARVAVLQMENDLHSAISIPQLVTATRTSVAGSGPAAGISFQVFASGPFLVTPNSNSPLFGYAAGQNQITVRVNGYVPKVGQRLCIPTHQAEFDITAVGSGTTDRTLTLASALPMEVRTQLYNPGTNAMVSVNVTCFITDRVSYVVSSGELRYFGRANDNTFRVMATDITSAQPFSIPATPAGAQFNRFVAAINLNTADSRSSNRGFKAANMFLNAMVPYRARMCTVQ